MVILRSSPPLSFLVFTFALLIFRSLSVHSLTCTSEKFTNNKLYSNCTDLPTLNSTLHYTFNPEKSTLSIAFKAPPSTPDGWIAWAINPIDTGMKGCQSFIAFKDTKGSMLVKTYNISSYSDIVEGKITFDVVDKSAEFSNGMMTIFATVKLPETMTDINQVWQVGGSVKNGVPAKHDFLPDNMKAMGKLDLQGKVVKSNGSPTVAGSPTVSPNTNSGSGHVGVYGIVIMFGCSLGFF